MVRKSFKEVMKDDVNNTFMNVDEFADMHTVDGKEIPVLVDDNEIIEREKKMKSNMDGVYVKQKLIYVKADDFGPLPAIGRQIVFDGKRYMVTDSTDEGGVYTITMEAKRAGNEPGRTRYRNSRTAGNHRNSTCEPRSRPVQGNQCTDDRLQFQ